jgi:hypothetical protein
MKDTMRIFRKAVYDCLNTFIIYKSANVAVYDEKVKAGQSPNLYVLFQSQRETDTTQTDCGWECKANLDLLIVDKTGSEVSKDTVDEISDQIYELLLNLPGSDNLAAQSGFKIMMLKRESAVTGLLQITPTQSELQKLITLTATISQ